MAGHVAGMCLCDTLGNGGGWNHAELLGRERNGQDENKGGRAAYSLSWYVNEYLEHDLYPSSPAPFWAQPMMGPSQRIAEVAVNERGLT